MADDGIDGVSRSMDHQPTLALSEFVRREDTMTHFFFQWNASAVLSFLMCSLACLLENKLVLHWSLFESARICIGGRKLLNRVISYRQDDCNEELLFPKLFGWILDVQENGNEGQNDEDLGNNASIGFSFSKLTYRIKNLCTQLQILQVRIGRFLFGFGICVPP
jgi:hypothetical protein